MTVLVPEGKYFQCLMLSFRTVHWSLSWGHSADKPAVFGKKLLVQLKHKYRKTAHEQVLWTVVNRIGTILLREEEKEHCEQFSVNSVELKWYKNLIFWDICCPSSFIKAVCNFQRNSSLSRHSLVKRVGYWSSFLRKLLIWDHIFLIINTGNSN